MNTKRYSGIELLRLFCIFGIVVMHSFANADTSNSFLNTEIHVLYNSLFNTGVTCFILISGYFSIQFNWEKLVRIDLMVIFFTLCVTLISDDIGIKAVIKACIPVLSRRYWFITCYFALCFLAPFLNQIPKHIDRSAFRKLLLSLLFLFSLIPTVIPYDIMMDSGKGLMHFIMIYLLGRYIAYYLQPPFLKRRLFTGFLLCILIIFISDSIRTIISGVLYNTFSRDCSIFIISASTFLFLFFRELHLSSRLINRIASNILAVTVLDSFLQSVFGKYISPDSCSAHPFLFLIILLYALSIVITAVLLNELRKFTIGRIDPLICRLLFRIVSQFKKMFSPLLHRLITFFIVSR